MGNINKLSLILFVLILSAATFAQTKDPIPGPKSCFWLRGPFSGDPYINIAYPDSATFYWAAAFTIPEGAKMRFEGKFPHARYMSLISYGANGEPKESVADYLIKPNAGSVNPFLPNADRTNPNRSYSLEVVEGTPPNLVFGVNLIGQTREKLHAPKYGNGQQAILYRIYANDKGQDETGGAGLPEVIVTMPDGKELRGMQACQALKTRQPLQIDPTAMALPVESYRSLLEQAKKVSPTHPASNPPVWYLTLGREMLNSIYTGQPYTGSETKSSGGFYLNLDVNYIRTFVNRKLGKVVVFRGKAPTTPKTLNGDAKMTGGDLRYWSFCSNQGMSVTRVTACLYDEQIPVDQNGFYTLVMSRKADRPRNAVPECGVAWLPMADDGDGALDDDVTTVGLRHMLGTQDFPNAVQKIAKPGEEAKTMGDYFPKGRYMSIGAFEASVPCMIEKK